MKRLVYFVLAMMAIVFAGGCHYTPLGQGKQIMNQMAASMETQCIGRYLVDFPKGFIWINPDLTLYYGNDENFKTLEVQVPKQYTTLEAFSRHVDNVRDEISNKVLFEDQSKSLLIDVKKEKLHHGVMINYYSDASGIGVDHELHLLVGHAHVLIKGSSFEGSSTDPEEMSSAVETRMLKLAEHIRIVRNPEKVESGFCLGVVVVDSDNDFESATMNFEMAKHPDVHMSIWMTNQDNPEKTLQQRIHKVNALADGRRLTILRSGDTHIAGMPAEEDVSKIIENRTEYQFVAEARPEKPSFAQEGMQISLDTGVQLADGRYVNSSLTQAEALALWDGIIKSFKPRPNAVRSGAR